MRKHVSGARACWGPISDSGISLTWIIGRESIGLRKVRHRIQLQLSGLNPQVSTLFFKPTAYWVELPAYVGLRGWRMVSENWF